MTNLLIFGASSTWGAWDKEKGGWVNRLRLFIEKNKIDIDIYNLGVSGDNSSDVLKRLENEINARLDNKTIVLISIGDNDSVYNEDECNTRNSLENYKQNIVSMIRVAKKFMKKFAFLGLKNIDESKVQPVSWDKTVYYSNNNIMKYDLALKNICKQEKIPHMDSFNLLKKEDLADGLHPNEKGHEKLFNAVKDFLIKEKII